MRSLFFLLLIRWLPCSTLFPTRRSSDLMISFALDLSAIPMVLDYKKHDYIVAAISHLPHIIASRSEEHTSELQSRFDLVCHLLLDKKKLRLRLLSNRSLPADIIWRTRSA